MIDTNQIQQAGEAAQAVAAELKTNWPAISLALALAARELGNFNRWVVNVLEFVIRHGGIGWLLCKLVWNPPAAGATLQKADTATARERQTFIADNQFGKETNA